MKSGCSLFFRLLIGLLVARADAVAEVAPREPIVTTEFGSDVGPLTTISVPWEEPSTPGTDARPAESVQILLRGIPIPADDGKDYLSNSAKTIFVVNLRAATHTSLAYVVLTDSRGGMHILGINIQVLALFPKSFRFPASDFMNVVRIDGNRLKMYSKDESSRYWCDFEIDVLPSGLLRLVGYKIRHEPR